MVLPIHHNSHVTKTEDQKPITHTHPSMWSSLLYGTDFAYANLCACTTRVWFIVNCAKPNVSMSAIR